MQNTVYKNSAGLAKAKFPQLATVTFFSCDQGEGKACKHAASGCDYPIGECIGLCAVNPVPSRSPHRRG